jgi:ACS family D-galactonate transporter-like MFS transporter
VTRELILPISTDSSSYRGAGPGGKRAIVPLMLAFAMISHVNRLSISTAGDTRIMEQYGISTTRMGLVYSAFLLTYTLFMVPGGLLIDRFGSHTSLMIVSFGSALFVALTGMVGLAFRDSVSVLLALLLVRGMMGVLSAPLHPALARSVAHWVPPRNGSRTNGLVNGAALVGIAVTPLLFGALIDRFDWPAAFLIMAVVTTALGAAWTVYAADKTSTESELTAEGVPQERVTPRSLLALFRHRGLMLLTISYGCVGYFQYLFFYWMNYYFHSVLHLPAGQSRFYAAIPPLAMAVGMPLGGWICDQLEHANGTPARRKVVPMAGMSAGAVFLMCGVFSSEPQWIVAWFALALGAVGMAEGPFWATSIDMGGRRGGSAAAVLNFGGNAGGFLAPFLTPLIGKELNWGAAVGVGGLICLVGVVLWVWIDPRDRVGTTRN